jgi:O-antigen/teichoic acid export membrane protein
LNPLANQPKLKTMSLHKTYLSASAFALFSKGFNIVAVFGILWLQNMVMEKEAFGLFMMALSLTFTMSLVLSTGFQALIMYHVSRKSDADPEQVKRIAGQSFWISGLMGLIFAGAIYAAAGPLAALMGHAALEGWLRNMALFVPVNTVSFVLPAYSRARQRIKETVFFQEIFFNFLRTGFIGLIWIFMLPQYWVAQAYIWSALIPVVILFWLTPLWPHFGKLAFTRWDIAYAFKSKAFQILNQPFRGLDIVIVGAFASAATVADYSMAVRLAQLLWVPKHAVSQLQVPRMGALLEKNDKTQLMLEYDALRCLSLLAVFAGCAFLCFFGSSLLAVFGDYQSALPALYILAAASVIRTGYGAAGDLLAMVAYPKGSVTVSIISVLIATVGTALLVPPFGALGGAYAILIGTWQMFAGFVYVIERKQGVKLTSPFIVVMNVLPTFALMALASAMLSPLLCGLLMLVFPIILLIFDKSPFVFIRAQEKTAT